MKLALVLSIVAAGAGAILSGVWLEWMNRRAATWPSASAQVTRSQHGPDPLGLGSTAEFSYRYSVGGRGYESDRVAFAAEWPSQSALLGLVARYPEGSRVTAWYDPRDPERAVIERPGKSGGLALGMMGLIVIASVTLFV